VLLGLFAAFAAGTSDFLGGLASRETKALRVATVAQAAGAVLVSGAALLVTSTVVAPDLLWGAISGVAGAVGLLSIYIGYAQARVGIAAPVAGVGAAALPALIDAFTGGEALGVFGIIGVIVGLVAVALVSMQSGGDENGSVRDSVLYGLGGAIGLGLLMVGLAQAGEDSGLWPLASSRAAGAASLLVVMLATRETLRVPRIVVPHIMGIAFIGTAANAAFMIASRIGSTAVAAVVTSLFPAFTVGWAVAIFGEQLRRVQVVGLLLALIAVALISVG